MKMMPCLLILHPKRTLRTSTLGLERLLASPWTYAALIFLVEAPNIGDTSAQLAEYLAMARFWGGLGECEDLAWQLKAVILRERAQSAAQRTVLEPAHTSLCHVSSG